MKRGTALVLRALEATEAALQASTFQAPTLSAVRPINVLTKFPPPNAL